MHMQFFPITDGTFAWLYLSNKPALVLLTSLAELLAERHKLLDVQLCMNSDTVISLKAPPVTNPGLTAAVLRLGAKRSATQTISQ